jgi:hypothetical protein
MTNSGSFVLACAAILTLCGHAAADSWDRDGSNDRWRSEYRRYNDDRTYGRPNSAYGYERPRAYKQECDEDGECRQEYRDRGCKVERSWDRNGRYKSEVECEGARR